MGLRPVRVADDDVAVREERVLPVPARRPRPEQALLDRHDGSGPGGEVRRALDVVRAAMPFASDADQRLDLAQRADVIRSAAERERVLGACVDVLTAAGAPNLEARCLIFTSALGLSDAALARVRAS